MMQPDWRQPLLADTIIGYRYQSEECSLFYCAEPCFLLAIPPDLRNDWQPVTVQDCQAQYEVCEMPGCEYSGWYQWPMAASAIACDNQQ